jgi:hypothetical protein
MEVIVLALACNAVMRGRAIAQVASRRWTATN